MKRSSATVWLACLGLCLTVGTWTSAAAGSEAVDAAPPRDVGAGVLVTIALRDPDAARARVAVEAAFEAAERVAALLFAEIDTSEIGILNHVPSHLWISLSAETVHALRLAEEIAEATGGAYDPTLPPLLTLWGVEDDEPHTPRAFEVQMALRKVAWTNVEVHAEKREARRLTRRTEVDLAGLALGAVLDAAIAVLRDRGVPAAHVRTASIHAAYGGEWRVPIAGLVFPLEGALAVATPGRRRENASGTEVHELIDPRSGYPARGTRLVAAAAADAASAGAWASALYCLGDAGAELVSARPGLEALIRPESGADWTSAALRFELPPKAAAPGDS